MSIKLVEKYLSHKLETSIIFYYSECWNWSKL